MITCTLELRFIVATQTPPNSIPRYINTCTHTCMQTCTHLHMHACFYTHRQIAQYVHMYDLSKQTFRLVVLASAKKSSASLVVWNSPLYKRYAHIMTPVRPCSEQEGEIQKGRQRRSGEKTKDKSCAQWHVVLCCYKFSMPAFSRSWGYLWDALHTHLSWYAVNNSHILWVLWEPLLHIHTKRLDQLKGRSIEFVKGKQSNCVWEKYTLWHLMELSETWQGYHWFMLYTA